MIPVRFSLRVGFRRFATAPSISILDKPATDEPVDILYTAEHWRMRESLRKLIDREINPHVDEWEKQKIFPAHEIFKKLGAHGFLGVNKPEKYGGLGLDWSYSIAVAEELGHINCGAVPMAIGVQTDMATPALTNFGSEELKQQFLVPTIRGDQVVCLGVSEPQAGSDVASIITTAKDSGGDLIINGGKMRTTNGCQADWMCLLANTSVDGGPHQNKSLICVPMKAPGVHVSRKIDKLGMHSSDTAQNFFRRRPRPGQKYYWRKRNGFHVSNDAIPTGANVGHCGHFDAVG